MKATHKHTCACGDYYVCSRRDGCDHEEWTCPGCELQIRDHFIEELFLAHTHTHTPQKAEDTHGHI